MGPRTIALFACVTSVLLCVAGAAGAQEIVVTSPAAGAVYHTGDTMQITWETQGVDSDVFNGGVLLEVSVDDGESWSCITCETSIPPDDPSWGAYDWVLPEKMVKAGFDDYNTDCVPPAECAMVALAGESVVVRVRNYLVSGQAWQSAAFTIVGVQAGVSRRGNSPVRPQAVRGPAVHIGIKPVRGRHRADRRVWDIRGRRVPAIPKGFCVMSDR